MRKNHLLVHTQKGTKQTHLLARSFKAQSSKHLRDKERKINKSVSVAWTPVEHPEFSGQAPTLVLAGPLSRKTE